MSPMVISKVDLLLFVKLLIRIISYTFVCLFRIYGFLYSRIPLTRGLLNKTLPL